MSDAFISYSRKNTEFAQRLVAALRDRSYDYWLDERDAHRSPDWWSEIQQGINSADNFLVVLSQESLCSSVCHLELDHALSLNKRIVVIALKDKADLNLAQALGVVAADDDPIIRQMAAGKDVLMVARNNWGALNKPTWVFFRDEDNFEEAFDHLMEVVETDHRHVRAHTRLLESAEEWQTRNREVSLLLIGTELDEAQAWLLAADEDHEKTPRPTNLQRDYIARSEQEEKRRIEEEKRRSAELHAAREQAEDAVSQAQAAAERAEHATAESNAAAERAKRARRMAVLIAAGAILAVIAVATLATISTATQVNNANTDVANAEITLTSANATVQSVNDVVAAAQSTSDALQLTILDINSDLAGRQGAEELDNGDVQSALGLGLEAFSSYPTAYPAGGGSLLAVALDQSAIVSASTSFNNPLSDLVLSHDRQRMVGLLYDTFALATIGSAENIQRSSLYAYFNGAAWSSDDNYFVTWDDTGQAIIWHAGSGDVLTCIQHNFANAYDPYNAVYLSGAAFNADTTRLATWSNNAGVKIWRLAPLDTIQGRETCGVGTGFSDLMTPTPDPGISRERTLLANTQYVDNVTWSNAGDRLLVSYTDADNQNFVTVFDAETGENLLTLNESHSYYFTGAQWSADDTQILTWGGAMDGIIDDVVHVWDSTAGNEVFNLQHNSGYSVLGAYLMTDEDRLLVWNDGGSLYLWELLPEGGNLANSTYMGGSINGATFSEDGTRLLVWLDMQTVNVLDSETLYVLKRFTPGGLLLGAAWAQNDQDVLTWLGAGTVQTWSLDSANIVRTLIQLQQDDIIRSAAWNRDGDSVLTIGDAGTVHVYDTAAGTERFYLDNNVPTQDSIYGVTVLSAEWTPDERYIVTWDDGGDVRLWDNATGEYLWERPHMPSYSYGTPERSDRLPQPVVSHDSSRLATWMGEADYQGVPVSSGLVIWNIPSGDLSLELPDAGNVIGVVWNHDDTRLMTWTSEGSVEIWDTGSGEPIQRLQHPDLPFAVPLSGARWNADESQILTWTQEGVLRVWDANSGDELFQMRHFNTINDAVWNADESRILTSSLDETAVVWDAQTGAQLFVMEHIRPLRGAAYSPDGSMIVTWANDGHASLWNATDGSKERDLVHDEFGYAYVLSASFSPNGRLVVTVSNEGSAIVWNATTGGEEFVLSDQSSDNYQGQVAPYGASWSADGERVLSWGDDTVARLWLVDMPQLVSLLQTAAPTLENSSREAFGLPTFTVTATQLPSATLTPFPQGTASFGRQTGIVADDAGNVWEYAGRAGEIVTISILDAQLVSGLDSFLVVYAPNGEMLAANDDALAYENTDSIITALELPETGTYRIEVREFPDGNEYYGSYTLDIISSLTTLTPSPVPTITPSFTASHTATVTPTLRPTPSAVVGEQDGRIPAASSETWVYEGEAGEIVTLTVATSIGLYDARLELTAPDGSVLTQDENWTDYFLQVANVTLPETGTYLIRVSVSDLGYRGWSEYSLDIISSRQTPTPTQTPTITPTMRPTPTAVAGNQNGFIPIGGGESWLYEGQTGDTVSFSVIAGDNGWDTYLYLYAPDGSLLTYNDDYNDLNSQIDITLSETGVYRVEVRSYGDSYGGNYDLNIVVLSTAAATTPTPSPTATATATP